MKFAQESKCALGCEYFSKKDYTCRSVVKCEEAKNWDVKQKNVKEEK